MKLYLYFFCIIFVGCAAVGKSTEDKKRSIKLMRQQVLTELYKIKPDVKAQIRSAPGYAVFSSVNVKIIFASAGGGYGVVRDQSTSQDTYMKMGEGGVGIGLGAKDVRLVMVFHTKAAMQEFINNGWDLGAQVDAAIKSQEKGDAVGREVSISNVTIYQLTETGLALQATIKGTKYWKDEMLNN